MMTQAEKDFESLGVVSLMGMKESKMNLDFVRTSTLASFDAAYCMGGISKERYLHLCKKYGDGSEQRTKAASRL